MSVNVVYVPDTGHVVGALSATGAAPPATATLPDGSAGPIDPGGLVGAALPIRVTVAPGNIATIPLAAKGLAVHSADDEPGVFAEPLAFAVQTVAGAEPKPALAPLPELTAPAFTKDGIEVTVPIANTTQVSKVIVYVADGQTIHSATAELAIRDTSVTLPVKVTAGDYGVLVLVSGWAGFLAKVTAK